MTIALLSNISLADLAPYLDQSDRDVAAQLSDNQAPAVTTLAIEWLKLGHRLVVFTLDPSVSTHIELHGPQLTVYAAPATPDGRISRRLAPFGRDVAVLLRMIRNNRITIDVVSAQWTRDYALAALHFKGKCPVYVTVRDIMPYIIRQYRSPRHYVWHLNYLKNEIVMRQPGINYISNSVYTAASVNRFWNRDSTVIPNSIADKFLSSTDNQPTDTSSTFRIATISMSAPSDKRKNILTLIKAFQIVRSTHPDVALSLIGPSFTTDDSTIKQWQADNLLIGVQLVGALSHDDVVGYLRHCDLMVHPSLEETFGNTLIESMAVGCPVLGGSDSGAVPYVLDHGHMGYLCDVSSPHSIAQAILSIINDPDNRNKIASSAQKYCAETFASVHTAQQYINLFNSAINE